MILFLISPLIFSDLYFDFISDFSSNVFLPLTERTGGLSSNANDVRSDVFDPLLINFKRGYSRQEY